MKDVLEALRLEKGLLEKLLGQIKKATALLAEDNIEGFDGELLNCEQTMRQVDELGLGRSAGQESGPAAKEISGDIERILKQIAEAQRECASLSEEKLKSLGRQIKNMRQKKFGINGYNQTPRGAVFIDAKK
jgi:polyhydroxyalkanoate synthesis regulator phasin